MDRQEIVNTDLPAGRQVTQIFIRIISIVLYSYICIDFIHIN